MTKYLLLLVGAMVITPGQGMQYIVPTTGGYNVINLGENAGVTEVLRTGNMTSIISPTEPTTFVIGNDQVDPAIAVDE